MRRCLPDRLTPYKARSLSRPLVAVNHTSLPSGDQASPCSPSHSRVSVRLFPCRSTTTTLPLSSPASGWSMKAIASACGENRM